MSVSTFVIIPAYEPDGTMITLLKNAVNEFDRILVVDDGSGAAFASIFEEASAYAHVISYPDNRGKGAALKTAYAYIREQELDDDTVVAVMDCDGQHTVCDTLHVCEVAAENPHALILGKRMQRPDSPLRSRFGNAVTRTVFAMTAKQHIYDTQTGLRAFHLSMLDEMAAVPGERYEYEMNVLMTFAKRHIPLIEIPIETIYIDNNRASHFHALKDSVRIYKEILKFSFSSFIGFLTDYSLYSLLVAVLGGTPPFIHIANVSARLISAAVNFTLNRKLVFHSQTSLWRSIVRYGLLALTILAVNTLLLHLLTAECHLNVYLAKLLTELLLFVANFVIQKWLVFRKTS